MGFIPNNNFRKRIFRLLMHSSAKLLFRPYGIYSQQKLPKNNFSTTYALERKAPFLTLWDLFPTKTYEKEFFDYSCTRAQSSFFDTMGFIPNNNFRKRIFRLLMHSSAKLLFRPYGIYSQQKLPKNNFSTTYALERKAPFLTLWDLFPTKTSEKFF